VLLRRPKDLAATRFSLALLSQVLWNGKRGTAMPSWRSLPTEDLTALAAYVQGLHLPPESHAASPGDLHRGNQVFAQNCAPCHGTLGDGRGPAAAALMPEPANFRLKQPDREYILRVVGDGIPGTAMPAWMNQISESDRKALADFVRSLYAGDNSGGH
jgi:mono/diheme cytochrome c family protein